MVRSFLLSSLVYLAAGLCLTAQTFTGTIQGSVRDPSGAPIANATVTASNVETGYRRSEQTSDSGTYLFSSLPPGNYKLETRFQGLQQETTSQVALGVNSTVQINITLQLERVTQQLEVREEAALVNTTDNSVGQVIDEKKVVDLPLNGRNFVQLALLTTGVESRQTSRGLLSVNGTRGNSTSFLFDGVDGNDANAIFQALFPSIEAVQEFNIQTNNYSAQFGRNAGGQINLVSKSGSNAFHGVLFEFVRNSAMDARDFFAPPTQPIPPYKRNQFGGVFSGPIRHNKMFFLLNYEGSRIRQGLTALVSVPTAAERSGDFSHTVNAATGVLLPVKDPASGQPFPGNIVPASRIDPTGAKVLALYPLPNLSGVQNFVSSPSDSTNVDLGTARFDYTISDKDTLFARYFTYTSNEYNPYGQLNGSGGTTVPGFGMNIPIAGQNVALNWTHVASPRTVLEVRLGYLRYGAARAQTGGDDQVRNLGIQGITSNTLTEGYPLFTIGGYPNVGDRTDLPQTRPQNTYHAFANLSRVSGQHSLRMGFEVRRLMENLTLSSVVRGSFTFGSAYTGLALGDVILGLPTNASRSTATVIDPMRDTSYGAYFQDDWKVSARLTLNLGLRYDYITPLINKYNNEENFDFASQSAYRVGTHGFPSAGYEPDRNNLGPRFGFAWLPFSDTRTVVRGGYGIFFDHENFNTFVTLANQSPFLISQTFIQPGSIANAFVGANATNTPPNLGAIQTDFRNAYYQDWNLMVERSLAGGLLFGAGYVGTKGTRVPLTANINQPYPGPGTPQSRRPYPQYGNISYIFSGQSSIYHSLALRAEKRLGENISFLLNYTFSKAIDDNVQDISAIQNVHNLAAERGLSSIDSPQRFNGSFVYQLPFGKGKAYLSSISGIGQALLGGWQFNGIVTLLTGVPFNPVVSSDIANIGANGQRPNRLADGRISNPSPTRWYDVTAFAAAAAGSFGNSGRNILFGPGISNADLSLFKEFKIRERNTVQFRSEFFNALNSPHFGQPNATVDSPNLAGRIAQTSQPNRQLQFALKYLF